MFLNMINDLLDQLICLIEQLFHEFDKFIFEFSQELLTLWASESVCTCRSCVGLRSPAFYRLYVALASSSDMTTRW